jgi:putative flippase GtrA
LSELTPAKPTPLHVFSMLDRLIWSVAARFGNKAREVDRFLKFAIVGGIGALVDFSTLNLLELTVLRPVGPNEGLNVGLATSIAFVLAVINNYVLNRYWTFPDSRSRSASVQLTQFFAVSFVGLLFRLVFVSLTYACFGAFAQPILQTSTDAESVAHLGSNVAQAISIFIVLFWNFFANRYWTYNDVE